MKNLYFLSQDNDCHWYLVRSTERTAWQRWLSFDSEDERSWTTPQYAKALGGGIQNVNFWLSEEEATNIS